MIFGILTVQAESILHRRSMGAAPLAAAPDLPPAADAFRDAFQAPSGVRYQVFRALRAMDRGEPMVVELKVPDSARHLANGRRREAWLRSLRSPDAWRAAPDVIPLLVPGTSFPRVIGKIVISAGWCAPSAQPHWVPNLRFYVLTDAGRESYRRGSTWWRQLTPLERLRAIVME